MKFEKKKKIELKEFKKVEWSNQDLLISKGDKNISLLTKW